MSRITPFLLLAATLVAVGCSDARPPSSGPDSLTRLRLGHFPNITHAPALVGVKDGRIAEAVGDMARLDIKVFNAGPAAMEALLAGELDMCFVGPSPAINTFLKSNGEALRVVSGVCSGGASLVATPASGIRSIQDLNGKRVATPQLGNTQDVSLRSFLAQSGLKTTDKGGTVEVLPAQNADIFHLFLTGKIDAAWVPEPWATRIVQEAGAVRAIDERTLWPDGRFPTTVLIARTKFLHDHPEIVEAVVQSNADTIAWMKAHEPEAKRIANDEILRLTGKALPESVLEESWRQMEFLTDPLTNGFESFLDAATAAGYARNPPSTLQGLFDLTALRASEKKS